MIYKRLEDIDWSKYEVDPMKGVYSYYWGDWLTGHITTEKKTGLKRRHLQLTDKNGKGQPYLYSRILAFLFVDRPEHLKDVPYEYLTVDHINADSLDDRVENLRWCTMEENNNNPITKERNRISNTGRKLSEEVKKKLSDMRMGDKNPMYGKDFSEEHRRRLSESHKGLLAGEKHPMYGKPCSQKVLEKVSKKVRQYDISTGETIAVYPSMSEAARQTGLYQTNISATCLGKHSMCGGYGWEYFSDK